MNFCTIHHINSIGHYSLHILNVGIAKKLTCFSLREHAQELHSGFYSEKVINFVQKHVSCKMLHNSKCAWLHTRFHFVLANILIKDDSLKRCAVREFPYTKVPPAAVKLCVCCTKQQTRKR
jgi:hypothetical protein